MSNKLIMVISILLITIFALSACQTDETDPGMVDTPVAEETPVVEETPVDGEPAPFETPTGDQQVHIVLWTKEGNSERGIQYVNDLVNEYTAQYPNVTFDVSNLDVETLRQDFLTASQAGNPPDLLWTVSDHAGLFTKAGLLQPVQDLFDMDQYVVPVVLGKSTWGVPISIGNHLMLIYNRSLLPEPPQDTNELIEVGQGLSPHSNSCTVLNSRHP
jgi:arabinogalactan oligomer / maltooligosaccharide transport system substrate-binding protein